MSSPDWVDAWDSDYDWAWRRRHELYEFAMKLLSFGPIKGQNGNNVSPREVMNSAARMNERTWVIWRNRLEKAEPPPPKPPKAERKKTPVSTPKYPPLSASRIADLKRLIDAVYEALPDADEKLRTLFVEFEVRHKLRKPTAAVEKSMWATIRSLGDQAEREYEDLPISTARRIEWRTYYPNIFDRLRAGRRELFKEEFRRGA